MREGISIRSANKSRSLSLGVRRRILVEYVTLEHFWKCDSDVSQFACQLDPIVNALHTQCGARRTPAPIGLLWCYHSRAHDDPPGRS